MEKPTIETLLVRRPYIPSYSNFSDDYAKDYTYDYIFYNDCNLSLLEAKFMAYFNNCIKGMGTLKRFLINLKIKRRTQYIA